MLSAQPAPAICSSHQTKRSDDHLSDQRQPVWPHYYAWRQNRIIMPMISPQPAIRCTSLIYLNIWWWISATVTARKQHRRQLEVCEDICQQIRNGSTAIAGIMAESFLREGTQKSSAVSRSLTGQSITDPCLGWEDTERFGRKTRLCGRYSLLNACPFLTGWAFLHNLLSSQQNYYLLWPAIILIIRIIVI